MRIIQERKYDFADVLIRPKRSKIYSRAKVDLIQTIKTLNSKRELTGNFIFAANMYGVGHFEVAEELSKYQMFTCLHKFYTEEELTKYFEKPRPYTFYTTGIASKDLDKLNKVSNNIGANIDKLCIDVASGYNEQFLDVVRSLRKTFPKAILMAGNVVTTEMVQELLITCGVDLVKVGVGPGAQCRTREVTGVGYPQLSSVLECSEVARGLGGHIISDGGCRTTGDICKAFGAGSTGVMLGTMLAAHDENPGEWEYEYEKVPDANGVPKVTGRKLKKSFKFFGMASEEAFNKFYGPMPTYKTSEGRCSYLPYKGSLKDTIQEINGALASCCSYVGARSIKNLNKCTTFLLTK